VAVEFDVEKRKAIIARMRALCTEARFIARDQEWKILERDLVLALIDIGDIETGKLYSLAVAKSG